MKRFQCFTVGVSAPFASFATLAAAKRRVETEASYFPEHAFAVWDQTERRNAFVKRASVRISWTTDSVPVVTSIR